MFRGSSAASGVAAGSARTAERMAEAAAAAAREDDDAALAAWVAFAHAGNGRAQADIGRCFVIGTGVGRDVELAHKWLSLAAKAGDPLGQRLLGDFYFNDEGGAPDRAIAEEWYARAAQQGEPDRFYNAVRDSCTPEQRRAAEQRAYLPLDEEGAAP
jgi:uncharacterized protein